MILEICMMNHHRRNSAALVDDSSRHIIPNLTQIPKSQISKNMSTGTGWACWFATGYIGHHLDRAMEHRDRMVLPTQAMVMRYFGDSPTC
jgi:hypothetical protein